MPGPEANPLTILAFILIAFGAVTLLFVIMGENRKRERLPIAPLASLMATTGVLIFVMAIFLDAERRPKPTDEEMLFLAYKTYDPMPERRQR